MGRLEEEAKKRYRKGDTVKCLSIGTYVLKEDFSREDLSQNEVYTWGESESGSRVMLHSYGKWAEVVSRTEFQQDDIEAGMKVMFRNGDYYLAVSFKGEIAFVDGDGYVRLDQYRNFSVEYKNGSKYDIIKVIKPRIIGHLQLKNLDEGEVVWEEKEEIPEYTVEELQDKLGIKFKIKGND